MGATLWQGVYAVAAGHTLSIKRSNSNVHLAVARTVLAPLDSDDEFAHILIQEIAEKARCVDRVVVRFSGGVDSTAVLLSSIVACSKPVTTLTWAYARSSSGRDAQLASSTSAQLGVAHQHYEIDARDIFLPPVQEAIPPNLSSAVAFHGVMRRLYSHVSTTYPNERVLILHGHGGDHLFLDPVSPLVLFDALKDKGLSFALKRLHAFSRLTGQNIWSAAKAASRPGFHALALSNGRPGRERHEELISEALFQNTYQPSVPDGLLVGSPFTCERMIRKASSIASYEFFDKKEARVPLKQSLRARHPNCPILRSDKGHITAAFQAALKYQGTDMLNRVCKGQLVQLGLVDSRWLAKQWQLSSMGVGGLDFRLMQAICGQLSIDAVCNRQEL